MASILGMRQGAGDSFVPLTVAIVWLFVSIPVSILMFLDWYRSAAAPVGLGRGVRNIARLPVFFFGVTAVLIGLGVLAWIAYNLLIERQPEFRWTMIDVAASTAASIIIFGIYLIRLSFWNPKTDR
jgi:hypothetical protein